MLWDGLGDAVDVLRALGAVDGAVTGCWPVGSAVAGMPNADADAHSVMSGVAGCGPGLSFGGVLVFFALYNASSCWYR